jgi:hypothetical protein
MTVPKAKCVAELLVLAAQRTSIASIRLVNVSAWLMALAHAFLSRKSAHSSMSRSADAMARPMAMPAQRQLPEPA